MFVLACSDRFVCAICRIAVSSIDTTASIDSKRNRDILRLVILCTCVIIDEPSANGRTGKQLTKYILATSEKRRISPLGRIIKNYTGSARGFSRVVSDPVRRHPAAHLRWSSVHMQSTHRSSRASSQPRS